MADTFKERLEKVTLRNMKVKHQKGKAHTMEKKIEVISQYLVLGNLRMVSATTGVDYGLIRQWKATPWWSELEQEIKATQNIEMDTKLSKIVERSLDAVADRLEHGDHFYDQKEGVIKRKPVAMRDAARVSVDMLSKRELLRGNATDRKETTQVGMNEQLKLLAAEFAKWVDPKKQEVIELVEVEDAVYSERSDMQEMPETGTIQTEDYDLEQESQTVPTKDL